MRKWNDESGQILVFAVGGVMVLAGFLALALDASLLFRSRRNLQIAADSAATAAALDYYYNSSSGAIAVTQADAVGVEAAAIDNVKVVNGTTVDVHCPVQNGVYKNGTCNGYFEAIIKQPNPTVFMGLFNHNSVTVATRAVAGTPYVSNACVYVLNSTGNIGAGGSGNGVGKGDSSVYLFGKFNVTAPNCGMVINGTASSDALNMQGGAGSLSAGSIAVVGGVSGSDSSPAPVSGAAPVENPLQAVPQPTIPASCTSGGSISSTSFVSGACYSGDSNGNLTVTNDTFNGTFIFTGTGTLTFGGNVTSGANGATIYLQNGGMSENAGTKFTGPVLSTAPVPPGCATGCFAAPTSGSLQGIALMAPSTNTKLIEFNFGNSTGVIDGITYMPGATLYLHNNSGSSSPGLVLDTDLIVGQIDDQAGSVTINSYSEYNPTLTPLKAVALVE